MIGSKTPDLIGVAFQSREQVERSALFDLAPLLWLRGIALSLRIESQAFDNQFARTLPVIVLALTRKALLSLLDTLPHCDRTAQALADLLWFRPRLQHPPNSKHNLPHILIGCQACLVQRGLSLRLGPGFQ